MNRRALLKTIKLTEQHMTKAQQERAAAHPMAALFEQLGVEVTDYAVTETIGCNVLHEHTVNGNKQYGISWTTAPQFGIYWYNTEADRDRHIVATK